MNALILFALTLCWDASPAPEVTKYGVFVDGVYRDEVPITRATVDGLLPGHVYSFKVTARTATGLESEPSNELRYVTPVMTIDREMVHFQIPLAANRANVVYHLESTTDFKVWRDENFVVQDEMGGAWFGPEPFKFYRVRLEVLKEGCAA